MLNTIYLNFRFASVYDGPSHGVSYESQTGNNDLCSISHCENIFIGNVAKCANTFLVFIFIFTQRVFRISKPHAVTMYGEKKSHCNFSHLSVRDICLVFHIFLILIICLLIYFV